MSKPMTAQESAEAHRSAEFAEKVRDLAKAMGLNPRMFTASMATMLEFVCLHPTAPMEARHQVAEWARGFADALEDERTTMQ